MIANFWRHIDRFRLYFSDRRLDRVSLALVRVGAYRTFE
jgi:hypothetical protein